jgi:hypothetical protein
MKNGPTKVNLREGNSPPLVRFRFARWVSWLFGAYTVQVIMCQLQQTLHNLTNHLRYKA